MTMRTALSLLATVLFVWPAMAADHVVQPLQAAAPADQLSPDIVAQLAPEGFKVLRGESRTVCEIWFCKEWPVRPDFQPSPAVLYPFQSGQLIGVVRFPRKSADFRNQDIASGVYTMRYAQQPVDGAHVGTSPTRDFFLLVKADSDDQAGELEVKSLVAKSAEAAGTNHPTMLCLQPASNEAQELPSIRHDEERDWWIVTCQGQAKAGEKTKPLPLDLVVVGTASE